MGKQTKKTNVDGMIGISQRFAVLNRLITRDMNNNTSAPTFSLYSKDNITEYLTNPYTYEKQLRKAVTYIYGASSHFRRLIQYFTGLSDFAYVVSPYRIDPKSVNVKSVNPNNRKVLNAMSAMNVRSQFPKILTVCLREDTFYGTLWVTNDNITIQQLPSDYCGISTIEGNVLNVTFDFSYFDAHSQYLDYYPTEFQQKYKVYQSNRRARWQELDSPTSFAIKCNNDILDYSIPPFAGILREVYDLEDYKQLKLTKTTLENYAMLVMTLGINEDGEWQMDLDKAKEFWRNLDSVLPEEIGSVLSPMPISKISFEIKRGSTVGIIGGTGSGKSTLINLIPRFYDVTQGSVEVDGRNVKDYSFKQLRKQIGIVPQQSILFKGTIRDNMKWENPDLSDEDIITALKNAQAYEFVSKLPMGLDSHVEQGGKNFSGGQRQRLCIARAIAAQQKVLILDDSFSALDFATDAALRKALSQYTHEMTVIIVTQRCSTIMNSDLILVLDDGMLVGKGTHKELLKNCETYKEICLSQLSKSEVEV